MRSCMGGGGGAMRRVTVSNNICYLFVPKFRVVVYEMALYCPVLATMSQTKYIVHTSLPRFISGVRFGICCSGEYFQLLVYLN